VLSYQNNVLTLYVRRIFLAIFIQF